MRIERHFLSQAKPLPAVAAAFLARDWESGHLDLRSTLAVVATRQAGRRLREALAVLGRERAAAVFPPSVVTPEFLVSHGRARSRIATALDALLAWSAVLREVDLDSFSDVFPSPPARRDFPWSIATGRELARVKRLLAEGGLGMRDVAARAKSDFAEPARWRALGELERRYRERLAEKGLQDADEAEIARAAEPVLPEGIAKVVLLAVPDPLALAVRALESLSGTVPVEVAIYAGEEQRDLFDEWGRPLPDSWEDREPSFGPEEDLFHPCAGPEEQARRAAELLAGCRAPGHTAAIGVADSELMPFLERSLPRLCGVATYNPEGFSSRTEELFVLLTLLRDLLRLREFPTCGDLVRCSGFSGYPAGVEGVPPLTEFLRQWDAFARDHMPGDLDDALDLAKKGGRPTAAIARVLESIRELLVALADGPLWESLPRVLQKLYRNRRFDEAVDADRRHAALAREMMSVLEELRLSPLASTLPRSADGLEILLALLGEKRIDEDRPAVAVELQGWLELLWEDAPYLVLTGMNESRVPETIAGDPFLPESLRQQLGLKNNRSRLARDRYLLDALVGSRGRGGRVDLLFGKSGESGDPLRPSRLLLQCAREKLPERVERLFAESPPSGVKPSWSSPWRLTPRPAPPPEKISVTQFGRYLRCPFRFYLSEVLGMEAADPRKAELDEGEFGDICHRVLEAFGNDDRLKRSEDPGEIHAFLVRELDRIFLERYGRNLSVPLAIQKESAAARLARLAAVQAEERREGWLIVEAEWRFPGADPWRIGGFPIRGVIDRVERNEHTGAYRILDYKTADKDKSPEEDHFANLKTGETPEDYPDYAIVSRDGKPRRWTGLQLPLYRWALHARYGEDLRCGYFNLPKAVSETGIRLWEDDSRELADAALRCAEGVVADVRRGRFWPPAASVPYDEFEDLFFGSAEERVDPAACTGGAVRGEAAESPGGVEK